MTFFFSTAFLSYYFLDLKNCKEITVKEITISREEKETVLRLLYKMFVMKSTISLIELATPQKICLKGPPGPPGAHGYTKESQDLQGSLAHEDLWI